MFTREIGLFESFSTTNERLGQWNTYLLCTANDYNLFYTHHFSYKGHSFVNGSWSKITKRIFTFQVKGIVVVLF